MDALQRSAKTARCAKFRARAGYHPRGCRPGNRRPQFFKRRDECDIFLAVDRLEAARSLVGLGTDAQVGAMNVAVPIPVHISSAKMHAHFFAVVSPIRDGDGSADRISAVCVVRQLRRQPVGRNLAIAVGERQPARARVERCLRTCSPSKTDTAGRHRHRLRAHAFGDGLRVVAAAVQHNEHHDRFLRQQRVAGGFQD